MNGQEAWQVRVFSKMLLLKTEQQMALIETELYEWAWGLTVRDSRCRQLCKQNCMRWQMLVTIQLYERARGLAGACVLQVDALKMCAADGAEND
jgi:hypothetical protein